MNLKFSAFGSIARRALALGLIAILFAAPFAFAPTTYAVETTPDSDHFIVYAAADGDTVCREANAAERLKLESIRPKDLRQLNHIELDAAVATTDIPQPNAPPFLTIILRATQNLEANAPAKAAFLRAVAAWEAVITSPVTLYLDADFGPNHFGTPWEGGTLGATSSPSLTVNYTVFRNTLLAGANTPAKQAIYNALPTTSVPTDQGPVSSVSVSSSIARALGILNPTAQPTDNAARIGFNSGVSFDFDPSNGITGGQFDFEAVVIHEIGHALGFTSRNGASQPIPSVWDLYRFRSGTTSATFTTAQRIMTIGGPTLNSQYYFVPGESQLGLSDGGPNPPDDPPFPGNSDGNQSSHWRQSSLNGGFIGIMDPRIPPGTRRTIHPNDIRALDVFGFNSNIAPPPPAPANDNFSAAQTITGCSGTTTGTNVSATHESGEPNHSPDLGGGSRSVWYSWQAPVTGQATIATAGSGFDTVLGVYTGNSVSSLGIIGRHDDNGTTDKTSTVIVSAIAGTTYKIAVDGYNNSGSGGDVGPVTLNWSTTNCTGSTVQFGQVTYSVAEAQKFINVEVTRTGNLSGPSTVDFRTSDQAGLVSCAAQNGVASERCDYATTVGTLRYAAGETSKTITIPIINDGLVEGFENFGILLSSPTGSTIGTNPVTTVTINDNDSTPATLNPIDGVDLFVTQQYIDFLGRLPDSTGLANWVGTLGGCPNGGFGEFDNPTCDRVHVSSGFFLSSEFQGRGYFAYRFYEVALDRRPTYAEFVPDMAQVGGAQSPESEALSKTAYTAAWTQRTEFKNRYDAMSNTQYVNTLEANAEITLSNKAQLIAALDGGQKNRGQVLREIVELQAVANRFFNRAFVAMQYFGYLRRDPDVVGFQNWVNTLNANPADFRHMIFGFLFSTEYRQRFGP